MEINGMDDDNDSSTLRIANGPIQNDINNSAVNSTNDRLFARKETRSVLIIKIVAVVVLVIAAVIVSVVVFIYGKVSLPY